MAYETGTAQNERDLLDKLNAFLTSSPALTANGQNWTVLYDRTFPATASQRERRKIMWKSTGTGVEQDIYIGCESVNNIARDTYNLNFWGGTFFNANLVDGENMIAGIVNRSPGVALFADSRPIEYHIVADGRCCKIVTRISNICSTAYLGFILPTVPPTEYPYPLCIAGTAPLVNDNNTAVMVRYSDTTYLHSAVVDPCYGNCWLLTPDQAWRDFYGYDYRRITPDSANQVLTPMANYRLMPAHLQPYVLSTLGASAGEQYPLVPVEFLSLKTSSQGANRWGAMDGLYWVPGLQRAAGDKIDITPNSKGIVFNNGFRVSTRDFFVLETGA